MNKELIKDIVSFTIDENFTYATYKTSDGVLHFEPITEENQRYAEEMYSLFNY